MKKILCSFILCVSFCMVSCVDRDHYKAVPEEVQGYRPVYFDTGIDILSLVFSAPPRPVQKAGKIYLFRDFLFVGEPGKGVHVFDNSDPSNPTGIAFINIPYNFDISVKDSVMYADTYMGLLAIDISGLPDITVLNFIRTISNSTTTVPPLPQPSNNTFRWGVRKTYFECVDPRKGVIVGWEQTTLKKPKCYKEG